MHILQSSPIKNDELSFLNMSNKISQRATAQKIKLNNTFCVVFVVLASFPAVHIYQEAECIKK